MFVIYGRRKIKVKSYLDYQHACANCRIFDLSVKVYREYFHVFFIPFFPTGITESSIRCNSCGSPSRIDSLQRHYEKQTKRPVYLYSGLILIAIGILLIVYGNIHTQKQMREYVYNPRPGDVYRIRDEKDNGSQFYFLRVREIKDDSVYAYAYHSNLIYESFVHKLNDEDYFVRDEELILTKLKLKEMLANDEINAVERGYDGSEGFNRIK